MLAAACLSFYDCGTAAADYSFYLDRFEISGQVIASDEFNDGSVSPWVILDPVVEESGGFVSFSSPGTIESGVVDGFYYLNEMSFIGSGYPSPFVVENGQGDFTGVSKWKPIIPGVNQWYEMQVGYEPHDISVGVANWDSEFAGILGIPSGLGISFYLSGDSLVWKHILISEDDLTNANSILLKLDFYDDTDEFRAGFSLDGGVSYQYFPDLIGWDQPTPGYYEWYFSGQALELAMPETMLAGLALFIMDEVDAGNIDTELERSLLVKVNAALAALDRGNPNDAKVAMNDLKALINQVEAQVGKKITPEVAAEVIQRANAIMAALSN
jgi:hypothetical protein